MPVVISLWRSTWMLHSPFRAPSLGSLPGNARWEGLLHFRVLRVEQHSLLLLFVSLGGDKGLLWQGHPPACTHSMRHHSKDWGRKGGKKKGIVHLERGNLSENSCRNSRGRQGTKGLENRVNQSRQPTPG